MKKSKLFLSMKVLLTLLAFFAIAGVQAQPVASSEVILANDVIISPNVIEFDLYVKSTNNVDFPDGFPYGGGQYRINFNPAIRNGANTQLYFEMIPGSTELTNTAQAPPSVTNPSLTQSFVRLTGPLPVAYALASIISPTGNGTKIVRVRMTSRDNTSQAAVPFTPGIQPNLALSTQSPGATTTSYVIPSGIVNFCSPQVLTSLLNNLPPNPAGSPPLAFNVTGGGSYCQGLAGLPVGLEDSELEVNYELLLGGAPMVPPVIVAGTGDAITFGDQLAGVYTVTGTNAFGSTPMTGEAVITEMPLVTSTVVIAADPAGPVCEGTTVTFTATPVNGGELPAYEWFAGGVSQGIDFSGSFSYVPVNGDAVYVVMTPDILCSAGNATSNTIDMEVIPTSLEEFTESACDTYTWAVNGETYSASGDYTYVDGCVTYILHLTIIPSSTVEETVLACDSYTWAVNGETYTESGTYTYVDGCVTYVLYLTITTGATVEVTETACDSYLWAVNGETYTESGDYTYVDGCITYILHLTIIPSSTVEFTAAACDSYTWDLDGMTYTVSGDYTFIDGCVTNILHLTITPSSTVEFTQAACDSYTWDLDGMTYTVSGDYTYIDGCVTNILHLTITPSSTVEFTEAACDSYTWDLDGMTYTVSGDYTFIDGCVTNILHLTITPSSTIEFTETAVGSYTWAINGVTYTESGTYTYVDGCVTYILYLTITGIPCPDFSTWNGSVSEDWFNTANWTPDLLPCETTHVTIPAGVPNFPTLTVPAECASMLILDGGSFIGAEYLTVAEAEVQRYFANSDFHFLSSPVTNINFGTVFPLNQDAVWAREYDEPSGDWVNLFVYDFMEVGLGYSIEMTEPQMALFPGVFNSADVTKTLSYQNMGGDPDREGWNLLGNPFQSAISWNAMVGIMPTAVAEAAVYVWDGVQYVSWNGYTGALTDGIIPAQNGFFVKAMADQEIFNIPLTARVHSNIPFYKSNLANLLKLSANGNNFSDAAFIRFNEAATPLFDGQHDAYKLWGLSNAPQLYSIVPGDVLSINELPFEGNEVVNLGFKCGVGGTYSITASGMESFSASTPVMLEDLKLNTIQDLRQNPVYNFTYNTSDNENRFRVHFKASTGINDPSLGGISVYSYNHTVVITNTTGFDGDVRIYDLAGRELINTNMGSRMTTRIPVQAVIGTYIVKVITEKGTVNHKVFIR
ncbi:MAG: T9SS type A sorting domain-containing protein [Lentimicrobium sp.]|nr:T9SS type A sorting domain-containing protein [Lentimicrobium sp.]